jgi:hypothetical protein
MIETTPGAFMNFRDKYNDELIASYKDGYAEARVYRLTRK